MVLSDNESFGTKRKQLEIIPECDKAPGQEFRDLEHLQRFVKPRMTTSTDFNESFSPSVPATSVSNQSVVTFDHPKKPRKRKAGKLVGKNMRKERRERKRKRIRFLKSIKVPSDLSTGYCSTALDSMNFSDSSTSSSASGVEADVESLGRKSLSDHENEHEIASICATNSKPP